MANIGKTKVKVAKKANAGEVIEVKTLITHPMETGLRKDKKGNKIPRRIINKFICKYDGAEVFSSDMNTAVSANPYLQFNVKATKTGSLDFEWHDDDGSVYKMSKELTVS